MGIINLSPDSFTGDGLGTDVEAAVNQAKRLVAEGADILDIGGESTRPDGQSVLVDEELRLVIPVLKRLSDELSVPISIDTYKSEVALRALEAGASMVNDVWGLKQDHGLAKVVAEAGVPIVLVSNQRINPGDYDIMSETISSLEKSINLAMEAGVVEQNIIIDPGIGFGKAPEQNLEIIRRLAELKVLRKPILLGSSGKFMGGSSSDRKSDATLATVAIGIANGADMVRVHDVQRARTVCQMSDSVIRKESG